MITTFPFKTCTRLMDQARRSCAVWCLVALAIAVPSGWAQPKITAAIDRMDAAVGETVNFTLSLEGANAPAQPQLPAIDGFELAGQSTGTQVAIINGQVRRVVNFTYALKPLREGTLTIPSLQFNLGGTTLTTTVLKLNITPDPLAAAVKRMAFGELILRKRALFVGEIIPMEFHLLFQNLAEDPSMPKFNVDGFTLLGKPATSIDTVVTNGLNYQRIIFRLALVAAKAGELTIGPVETKLVLRVPRQVRNDSDPFAAFMGRNYELRAAEIQSEIAKVQILPLPSTGVPPNFSGSIGNFQLSRTVSPTTVTVGDPITQKIRITGAGAFDGVKLSDPEWADFRSYAPTSKFEPADDLGVRGVKEFDLVVSPMTDAARQLPSLEFSFFDPEAGQYRTVSAPPVALTVKAATTFDLPPSLAPRTAGSATASETAHIKPRPGTLRTPSRPWLVQGWFLGVQTVPLIAFVAAFLWRQRIEHSHRNPHLRRGREIAQAIERGLTHLQAHATANRSEPFHATLFRLLQEAVGDRLKRPAASITEAAIDELPEASDAALRTELHTLFRLCNEARYAPVSTAEQLSALRSRAAAVVSRLRGSKEAK